MADTPPPSPDGAHNRVVALAGATGLVGRAILEGLLADASVASVHALGRREPGGVHPKQFVSQFEGDTHLVVYVAAKSHASYPVSGTDVRGALTVDHHDGNNPFFLRARDRIVNVGRTAHPFPGSEWIEYRSYWGQDCDPANALFVNLEGASPTPDF